VSQIKVRQVKSGIGTKPAARATLRALGLKKIGDEVVQEDTPAIRGMAKSISHLVSLEEVK